MSDPNNLVYRDQLDDNVIDMLSEDIGSNYSLRTENQKTITAALNEIHGKDVIANVVGDPLLSTDTYNEMGRKLRELTVKLKNKLLSNGIAIAEYDKLNSLIEKIEVLGEGVGYGLEIVTGVCDDIDLTGNPNNWVEHKISYDLSFVPNRIIFNIGQAKIFGYYVDSNRSYDWLNFTIDSKTAYSETNYYQIRPGNPYLHVYISNITDKGFSLFTKTNYVETNILLNNTFDALGDGSSALLDTLKDILINNNVELTGNESLADLIVKVGNEFDNKNNTIQTNRDKLYNLMLDGGYEVTNDMTLDALLEMIKLSGIENNDIKYIRFRGTCTEATFLGNMLILKENGKLYGCGANQFGQLGLGDTESTKTYLLYITDNVKEVYSGYSHTFILKNDGSLWACGHNNMGQLGLGDTTNRSTFTQVTTNINNDVKEVSCGYLCTFIIKNDGSIWACGYNSNGQLGLNDTTNRSTFTQVTTNINNDVKEVSCGYVHTFILKNDGSLWACGYNNYGQLGLGDTNTYKVFTQVTTNINNDIKQVECGTYHTFIVKNDGSLWSCGYNDNGQLGLGNNNTYRVFTQVTTNINNDVKQISSFCCYHAMIIKNDGSLWACGRNSGGQLGLGVNSGASKNTFTKVTTNISNDVKQVECSAQESVILKNDGTVWVCGYSSFIGLGYTSQTSISTFTKIPEGFTY